MKCFSLLGVVELPETRLNNNLKEKENKMKIVVENRKVARNWRKTKVLGGHQQSVCFSRLKVSDLERLPHGNSQPRARIVCSCVCEASVYLMIA